MIFIGIKVISNAGGINPISCGEALEKYCKKMDVKLNIAVITGDDLLSQVDIFICWNVSLVSTEGEYTRVQGYAKTEKWH